MENLRDLLTNYAYNILGTIDEAQDVVQDAFCKFITVDSATIENQKAYLIRMVINLSINRKKKLKKILSDYPGVWLPEPVATEGADSGINRKQILSYSLIVLLEKLSAKQRAVFILKEAFDYDHSEIGNIIGTSEENSRQLLRRAKKQLANFAAVNDPPKSVEMLGRYLDVIYRADTQRLEELLHEDIMICSDGGGKVVASLKPVHGKPSARAMLLGIYKKFYQHRQVEVRTINHQPALCYFEKNVLTTCKIICIKDRQIDAVFIIRNPDKLIRLENFQKLSRS